MLKYPNYFILNGWNITEEEGILLIDSGEERANKPKFQSEKLFGGNGNINLFEGGYETYSRTFIFYCTSQEKVDLLVERFRGENMKCEIWTRPNHYIYIDFKNSVPVTRLSSNLYKVKFQCDVQPFKYIKNISEQIFTANGTINNIGNIYSEPKVIVEGNGKVSLAVGNQVMRLNLDTRMTIDCRHRFQNVFDKNNQLAISSFSGDFFEIQPGRQGVILSQGITKVTIHQRWRIR